MSSFPLPIRAAVPPPQPEENHEKGQEAQAGLSPAELSPAPAESQPLPPIDEEGTAPLSARQAAVEIVTANVARWVHATSGLQPAENHQFWVNDPNIAENLFTIHRSTKHLLDFTSSMIGNNESFMGHRPVPVMSDGDVLFMTQLSSDISRGVGSISAIRHHGLRAAKKRKSRPEGAHHQREDSSKRIHSSSRSHHRRPHHPHRAAGAGEAGSSAVDPEAVDDGAGGVLSCWKCGRTDTPQWRKGSDGEVLCNACGLVYAKQRRKGKGKATHHSLSEPS
ncbi:hypothetical protein diail_6177 [Diaporthe ilicicola]|nr:hypothetical protein diail_6177 [Diaporthe ilicicola]